MVVNLAINAIFPAALFFMFSMMFLISGVVNSRSSFVLPGCSVRTLMFLWYSLSSPMFSRGAKVSINMLRVFFVCRKRSVWFTQWRYLGCCVSHTRSYFENSTPRIGGRRNNKIYLPGSDKLASICWNVYYFIFEILCFPFLIEFIVVPSPMEKSAYSIIFFSGLLVQLSIRRRICVMLSSSKSGSLGMYFICMYVSMLVCMNECSYVCVYVYV